jgi:hypothetical protein
MKELFYNFAGFMLYHIVLFLCIKIYVNGKLEELKKNIFIHVSEQILQIYLNFRDENFHRKMIHFLEQERLNNHGQEN